MITNKIYNPKNNRHIYLHYDGPIEINIDWILNFFKNQIEKGTEFRDGETIQLGWMILKLILIDNALVIHEPDFKNLPIVWRKEVSRAIKDSYLQNTLCESILYDPVYCNIRECLAVHHSPSFSKIKLHRNAKSECNSKWELQHPSSSESNSIISLYESAIKYTYLIPYYALPLGSEVVIDSRVVSIKINDYYVDSTNNNFLNKIFNANKNQCLLE